MLQPSEKSGDLFKKQEKDLSDTHKSDFKTSSDPSTSSTSKQRVKNWGMFILAGTIGLGIFALCKSIGIPVDWVPWFLPSAVLGGSIIWGLRSRLKDYPQSNWDKIFERLGDIESLFEWAKDSEDVNLDPRQTQAFREWAKILLHALENHDGRLKEDIYNEPPTNLSNPPVPENYNYKDKDIRFLRGLINKDEKERLLIEDEEIKNLKKIFERIKLKKNFLRAMIVDESDIKKKRMRFLQGFFFVVSLPSISIPPFLYANVGGAASRLHEFGLNHFGASLETMFIVTASFMAVTAFVATLGNYWVNNSLAFRNVYHEMGKYADYLSYRALQAKLVSELHGSNESIDYQYAHTGENCYRETFFQKTTMIHPLKLESGLILMRMLLSEGGIV